MAFFRVRVDEKIYELDRLTLGEARTLKREFGLTDLASFHGTDPDQLVGLLYLALRRENPGLSHDQALSEIENLDVEGFEAAPVEEEATDPPAAVEDASVEPDGNGNLATTPVIAGTPD